MEKSPILNIVFYTENNELDGAIIFRKGPDVKFVSINEGLDACHELGERLRGSNSAAMKDFDESKRCNQKYIYLLKKETLMNHYSTFKDDTKNPLTEEELRDNNSYLSDYLNTERANGNADGNNNGSEDNNNDEEENEVDEIINGTADGNNNGSDDNNNGSEDNNNDEEEIEVDDEIINGNADGNNNSSDDNNNGSEDNDNDEEENEIDDEKKKLPRWAANVIAIALAIGIPLSIVGIVKNSKKQSTNDLTTTQSYSDSVTDEPYEETTVEETTTKSEEPTTVSSSIVTPNNNPYSYSNSSKNTSGNQNTSGSQSGKSNNDYNSNDYTPIAPPTTRNYYQEEYTEAPTESYSEVENDNQNNSNGIYEHEEPWENIEGDYDYVYSNDPEGVRRDKEAIADYIIVQMSKPNNDEKVKILTK